MAPEGKVVTADGEVRTRKARATSRKLCLVGLLGVPFLWVVHLWYFWPEVKKTHGDPYIKRSK